MVLDWKRWEFRINDLITFLGLFVTLYLLHPFLTMSSIYEMSRLCTSCLTTPLIAFNIISFFLFIILCTDSRKNLPNLMCAKFEAAFLHFKRKSEHVLHTFRHTNHARLQFCIEFTCWWELPRNKFILKAFEFTHLHPRSNDKVNEDF